MIVKVHEHTIEIEKSPVNELEVNITKVKFEFDEALDNYVKKAFFSNNDASIEVLLENNECNIPNEVLKKIGQVRLGVIAYEVQNDTLIERYNPSPCYFSVSEGSMIEADNTEPITPTDKEQIEQAIADMEAKVDNIDIDATKEDNITTITITKKDGSQETTEILDGVSLDYNWSGTQLGIKREDEQNYSYVDLKGEKGDPGAIKMLIVAELPETGADDTIYLVPITPDTSGNNYAEYVYINGAWELLGKIGVQVDLQNYVQFTDYPTNDGTKSGVIKVNSTDGISVNTSNKRLQAVNTDYGTYQSASNSYIIGKGTLENWYVGKGITTKSYVDGLVGDINSALDLLNGEVI